MHTKIKVTLKSLYSAFINQELEGIDTYIKATHLIICYYYLLAREDFTIDEWAWVLVEDLKEWNNFPWGAYVYQMMFDYVDMAQPKEGKKKYRLNGPVWVLHYWAYETFPKLEHVAAQKIDGAKLPRCLRWRQIINKGSYVPLLDKADVSFVILNILKLFHEYQLFV